MFKTIRTAQTAPHRTRSYSRYRRLIADLLHEGHRTKSIYFSFEADITDFMTWRAEKAAAGGDACSVSAYVAACFAHTIGDGNPSYPEAFHTREHEDYNQGLRALGYDVDGLETLLAKRLKGATKPLHRLAVTCAIEHLTTAFAATILANPQILDAASPAYDRLWRWHALEELEHRAVAIDVLNTVTASMPGWKRYALRIVVFNTTAYNVIAVVIANVCSMARHDGVKLGPVYAARTLWRMVGWPGMARKAFWRLMAYYKPGFDPAREHDPEFVRMWQACIAAETEQAS